MNYFPSGDHMPSKQSQTLTARQCFSQMTSHNQSNRRCSAPVPELSMELPCGLDALQAPVGWPGHSIAAGSHFYTPRVSGCHPVHRQKGSCGLSRNQERLGEESGNTGHQAWLRVVSIPTDIWGSLPYVSAEYQQLTN